MKVIENGAQPFSLFEWPCLYSLSPSSILILEGLDFEEEFIRVDVNTMHMLDFTLDENDKMDDSPSNQSVEWHGKVYILGEKHIHVITEDCKKYKCIKYRGSAALK